MPTQSLRVVVVLAVALVTALAGADRASAAGAVFIDACQTLSDANTTYKLTTDLTSCGDCLVVANNKITIDLQGHSITSTCGGRSVRPSPTTGRPPSTSSPSRTAPSAGSTIGVALAVEHPGQRARGHCDE